LLDGVSCLAVLRGGGAEAENGADGEIGAGGVVFASVESGELEGGNVVVSRDQVAVVACLDGVGSGTVVGEDRAGKESDEDGCRK